MELRLNKPSSASALLAEMDEHVPADLHSLLEQKEPVADKTLNQTIALDKHGIDELMRNASFYITLQAILTTPKAKKHIVDYIDNHQKQTIDEIEQVTPIDELELLKKRSTRDQPSMEKITRFLTLLIREGEDKDLNIEDQKYARVFTHEVFPFLKTAFNKHKKQFTEIIKKNSLIHRVHQKGEISLENEEVADIATEINIPIDHPDFKSRLAKEMAERAMAEQKMSDHGHQKIEYTVSDIQKLSKKLDNPHKRTRTQTDTEGLGDNPSVAVTYKEKDVYVFGLLYFMSEYLHLLPHSAFVFDNPIQVLVLTNMHALMETLYGADAVSISKKNVKIKDRPLPVHNDDTLGQALIYSTNENHDVFISHIMIIYEVLGEHINSLWNTPLNKTVLNQLSHLIDRWSDIENWSQTERERAFILGVVLFAVQQKTDERASNKEEKEMVIRMDQAEKSHYENALEQKDSDIKRLQMLVKQKNDGLKELESLKQKNAELEEKLKWQEEKDTIDQKVSEKEDEEEEPIDTALVKEQLNRPSVCFLGGDLNWQQSLKEELPEAVFQLAEESNRSMSHVERASIIVYNTATMNHGLFYRFKNHLKRNPNKPKVIYLNTQGSNIERTYKRIGYQMIDA